MIRPRRFLKTPGAKCPVAPVHVPDKRMSSAGLIRIILFYLAFRVRRTNRVVYIRNTLLL